MTGQTGPALIGIVVLLVVFQTLPLLGLFGRAVGWPGWTYGELTVSNAALARAFRPLPAWLPARVVALSVVVVAFIGLCASGAQA